MGSESGQRIHAPAPTAPLIAADVGGTHARIALIDSVGGALAMPHYEKYACGDFPSLAAIVARFRDTHVGAPIERLALAIAGYIIDDAVVNVSLPWRVSISALREELGLREFAIVNDFEAAAHALGHLDASETILLSGPPQAPEGPLLLVGPGTGLGAAVRIPHRHEVVVLATEAGQATLAPDTALEFALLEELRRRGARVLIEDVMSGTGLANLHAAVRALRGAEPSALTPAQITAAALAHSDAHAVEAVEVFCGWFGSVLGDLALLYGATGGVYLAGGVLPQMKPLLQRSRFVERFLDKGVMREMLARTPVRLVEHARLGVIGAASWFFQLDSAGLGTSRRDAGVRDASRYDANPPENTRRASGADTPAGTAALSSKDRQDPASGVQRTRQRTTT